MGLGDWIFIAVIIGFLALGALLGFGRVLKFITGGIVGIIISILLCYCFGGMILDIPFINRMLTELAAHWQNIEFFVKIHLELIIYYVALFIVFMLARIIIVFLIKHIAESRFTLMRVLNRVGGALLVGALAFTAMLLVFQLIYWIGGNTRADFNDMLAESCNGILRPLFEHNPMRRIIEMIKESNAGG